MQTDLFYSELFVITSVIRFNEGAFLYLLRVLSLRKFRSNLVRAFSNSDTKTNFIVFFN